MKLIAIVSLMFNLAMFTFSGIAHAKLNVIATTADIQALVRAVALEKVELSSIAKGSQDPHYIEAKPSFMTKMHGADLVVANGLSLEVGWLPSLVQGARNPKIAASGSGYLDLGALIDPIEKPTGTISRADGDVHPDGNPHFTLDPIRMGDLAIKIADRLGELDPTNKEFYAANAKSLRSHLITRTDEWKSRITRTGVKQLITQHPSLNYLLGRLGLTVPIYLEPKPGVPPSAQHILKVIATAKQELIRFLLVENFFEPTVANRVAKEVPGTKVITIGISVDSAPGLSSLESVIEQIVRKLEDR